MARPGHIFLVADVGGDAMRHIGDEAMLEANLDALRSLIPRVAFTVMSRDPAWVSKRYGVDAVPLFGFPRDRRTAPFEHIEQSAAGRAIAAADAVVVSGGGNLSPTWPDLLYERIASLQLARRFSKPAALLGQTIGPRIEGDDRQLLADALADARFVGVREAPSAALVASLGVPHERLWYQCDDATFLDDPNAATPREPVIAVTIDAQLRAKQKSLFPALANQLRTLSETTGARLVFVPHVFGGAFSDLTEGRLLAERIGGARMTIAEGLDARETFRVTAEASLVISTRYHPIVFGLAAGVASLGIYGDDYCRIKLQGALAHAGLERWALTYDALARGELLPQALRLWKERDAVRQQLIARRESWCEERRERWSAVLDALDPAAEPRRNSGKLFGRPAAAVVPALTAAFAAERQWADSEYERIRSQLGLRQTLKAYAGVVRTKLRGS